MKLRSVSLLCSLALLQGCATTYVGPAPNLGARGEEAKQELRKFHLSEGYFSQGPQFLAMGPEGKEDLYWASSLAPVVEKVSAEAAGTLRTSQAWADIALGLVAVTVGAATWSFVASKSDTKSAAATVCIVSGLSSVVVNAAVVPILHMSAARSFNRDLRAKLAPGVGLALSFR